MANEIQIVNQALVLLNTVFRSLVSIYLPILETAQEESNDRIREDESVQPLLASISLLFKSLNNLLALATTCGQVNTPRPRLEHALHPNFRGSQYYGRNFVDELEGCEHLFWYLTGESIESFRQIVRDVTPYVQMYTRRRRIRIRNPFSLNIRNRLLLVIIWLRMYPELVMLSGLFMVSPATIEREIRFLLPVLWSYFKNFVTWPTEEQWLEMSNNWEMFPGAVGVIDGTRHRIHRPQTEPQQDFYSGHCRYHNFSTQIIMDNRGSIVYIQSGFLGHNNDSGQWQMMPSIGFGGELHLPLGVYILGDKGYPCSYPLLTPYRDVGDDLSKQLFNSELAKVRTLIEHCIRRVKEYGAVHHLWRHERWMFPIVNELCPFLAQRHIELSRTF